MFLGVCLFLKNVLLDNLYALQMEKLGAKNWLFFYDSTELVEDS